MKRKEPRARTADGGAQNKAARAAKLLTAGFEHQGGERHIFPAIELPLP